MFPCSDFISSYLLLIRTHMDRALTHSRRFISEWSCNWSVGIGCIEAITPRKWWNCPVGNRLQLEKPGPQSVSLTRNMDQLLPCNSRSIYNICNTRNRPATVAAPPVLYSVCEQLSFIHHLHCTGGGGGTGDGGGGGVGGTMDICTSRAWAW